MNDYLAALLFFLPAGVANMIPPIANKIPILKTWKTPLDFGTVWHGKRLLGANKTWRGLISGMLAGGATAVIVSKLNANTIVTLAPFLVGCLLGLGALLGDAAESLVKRKYGFKPGQSWFPFDQVDYILGGLLIIVPIVRLPVWAGFTILFVYFGLHLLTAYVGYLLKFKDSPI